VGKDLAFTGSCRPRPATSAGPLADRAPSPSFPPFHPCRPPPARPQTMQMCWFPLRRRASVSLQAAVCALAVVCTRPMTCAIHADPALAAAAGRVCEGLQRIKQLGLLAAGGVGAAAGGAAAACVAAPVEAVLTFSNALGFLLPVRPPVGGGRGGGVGAAPAATSVQQPRGAPCRPAGRTPEQPRPPPPPQVYIMWVRESALHARFLAEHAAGGGGGGGGASIASGAGAAPDGDGGGGAPDSGGGGGGGARGEIGRAVEAAARWLGGCSGGGALPLLGHVFAALCVLLGSLVIAEVVALFGPAPSCPPAAG
jgi:hypothetical protein